MRRPEVKETQTLARLTFNPAAMRQLFDESTKGVRLRIEHGVVGFRPSASVRGADVILLERRHRRGVDVDIVSGQDAKKLMTRLFRAGLTEDQPYFSLEPQARGWFGIAHVVEQPDPRQPLLLVSDFESPPPPVDLFEWRRFMRIVNSGKAVDADLWAMIRRMVRGAVQVTAKPQRGRLSQIRLDAEALVKAAAKNGLSLLALAQRQPDYASDVTALLADLGIEDDVEREPPRRRRASTPEPVPDEPEPAPPDEPEPPPPPPEPETSTETETSVVALRAKRRRKHIPVYEPEPETPPASPPDTLDNLPTPHEAFDRGIERGIDRLLDEAGEGDETEATEAGEEAGEDGAEEGGTESVAGAKPAIAAAEESQPEIEEFVIEEVALDDALDPEDVEVIEDWGAHTVSGGEPVVVGPPDEAQPEDAGPASVTGAEGETVPAAAATEHQDDENATDEGGEGQDDQEDRHHHGADQDTTHPHGQTDHQPDEEK